MMPLTLFSTRGILRSTFAVVALLLGSRVVEAQSDPLSEDWRWSSFDSESGLPSYDVSGLVVASDGTAFASASSGVAWYDGFRWHAVPHSRGIGFGHDGSMRADLDGAVLVVGDGHLFRVNRSGVERVDLDLEVVDAIATGPGEILVLTERDAYLEGPGGMTHVPAPPGIGAGTRLGRTDPGTVWASTARGTWRWSGGRWSELLEFPVFDLFEDEREAFLAIQSAAESSVLWSWARGGTPTRLEDGTPGLVCAACVQPDGSAVICYESGSVRTRRDGVWRWLQAVPDPLVQPGFLHFQTGGDIWVGLDDGVALFRGSSNRWEHWRLGGDSRAREVDSLLVTRGGDVWIGTSYGLQIRRRNGEVERVEAILGQSLGIITGLAEGRDGSIWVSSGSIEAGFPGAYRLRDGAWQHIAREQGLDAQRVHDIVTDRSGRLWFLGLSDRPGELEPGAFVLEGGEFERWGTEEGLASGRVYAFAEGPDGSYWFGTRAGLSRHRNGEWTHWDEQTGLRTRLVFTVAVTDDGRAWFGHWAHGFGLGELDQRGNLRYHTTSDGLSHNKVNGLAVGAEGTLYITTRRGLSLYRDRRFSTLGRAEGFAQPATWRMGRREGRVYLGTSSGDIYVLGLEEAGHPPPRVEIQPALLDDGNGHFRWQVAAYRGELPRERIESRHSLDGGSWSPWSRARKVSVTGTEPGEHTFRVQAKGLFGGVAENSATTSFRVPSPIYSRRWFVAVVSLWIASMAGFGIVHWRRRRHDHRLLHASEEHFRTLVEEVPICIHEIDLEGRVLTMNPAGLAMLDVDGSAAVEGMPMLDAVAAVDRERIRGHFERAVAGTASEFEFAVADRASRTFASSFVPLEDDQGRVVKLMGYTQDVTDRKRAEEQRRKLEKQVRLAQKMEAVGLLAGGVAHDFNNLLTVISGHASLIGVETASERVQHSVSEILRAQARAESLARQLLAFGRRQVLEPRVFDLNEILAGAEEMLRGLVDERTELHAKPCSEPMTIEADLGQVERVIMNLVLNARDAMPDGGRIELTTGPHRFDVDLDTGDGSVAAGDYVALSVTDTGTGIKRELQSRIFEPFFTTKSADKGSGLGLAMVYGTVQQSGGHVDVQSRPGEGATFTVYLPRVEATVEASEAQREPRASASDASVASGARARTGNETVLVVDDEDAIRELVATALEQSGYAVLSASDGPEALRLIDAAATPIDLLLTDLAMPGMNGRELATQFRETCPRSRVVYMSGNAAQILATDGNGGPEPFDLLRKPFLPGTVVERVRKALELTGRT